MSTVYINEIPAGREMDALVAERIFNALKSSPDETRWYFENHLAIWVRPAGVPERSRFGINNGISKQWEQGNDNRWFTDAIPHYSTDIAAAFLVMEKTRLTLTPSVGGWAAAWCNARGSDISGTTWVGITNGDTWSTANTAPLAICRAALLERRIYTYP